MSKQIRVDDQVYERIASIQRPRETLTNVISRLLDVYDIMMKVEPIIRGQHELSKWQAEQREKQATPH